MVTLAKRERGELVQEGTKVSQRRGAFTGKKERGRGIFRVLPERSPPWITNKLDLLLLSSASCLPLQFRLLLAPFPRRQLFTCAAENKEWCYKRQGGFNSLSHEEALSSHPVFPFLARLNPPSAEAAPKTLLLRLKGGRRREGKRRQSTTLLTPSLFLRVPFSRTLTH